MLILIQVVVSLIAVGLLALLGWLADKLSRPLVPRPERSVVPNESRRTPHPVREESTAPTPVSKPVQAPVLSGAKGCSYGVCGGAGG
ncbi:hypothetical protein GCM10009743_12210 [Kribbella swartbergensis]